MSPNDVLLNGVGRPPRGEHHPETSDCREDPRSPNTTAACIAACGSLSFPASARTRVTAALRPRE